MQAICERTGLTGPRAPLWGLAVKTIRAGDSLSFVALGREAHPAANLFPLLGESELEELAADVRRQGLLHPIVTLRGKILDGRNRALACERAGIEGRFVEWNGEGSPVEWVVSTNLVRRHLTAGQRAMLAVDVLPLLEAEAKARMKAGGGDQKSTSRPDRVAQDCATRSKAATHAAATAKVSPRYVEDAKAIKAASPTLAAKVRDGSVSLPEAKREIKREAVVEKLAGVAARHAETPTGLYDVLVVDPPWPVEKIERDVRPNQTSELDYPTMTLEEIKAMSLPADASAHLWLWTTHRFLPASFEILSSWGFRYVCAFVWHKPGGFQPVGLPQFNCEFALYARKGAPVLLDTKALPLCFEAPRGKHSEKPEAFYDVVRRVTGGRRIDMFSRRAIEGFDAWGKEA